MSASEISWSSTFVLLRIASQLKGDMRSKFHLYFYGIFLLILWRKKPCTKLYGVLVRLYEVIKLQNIQFDVSKVMPANLQNSLLRFSLHLFVSFMEKKPPMKFYGVLDLFP